MIETLLRLASAFDVAVEIGFVPFSELVDRSETFDPENFEVPSFKEEIKKLEQEPMVTALNGATVSRR